MKNKILKESENLELQDYIRDIIYGEGFVTLEKIDFDIYHAPYNFTVDDVVREARRYGFKLGYVKDEGYSLIYSNNVNKKLNTKNESLNTDIDTKAVEVANPVYADAIRGIKRADKAREEYRKLPKAEKREENPKVKGNSHMKKMYLSESLFEDYDEPSDYLVIVYEDGESSIEGADQYTIDDMCAELEYMPDEELEQREIAGWARLYLDDDGYIRRSSSYAREDEFEELVKNTIRTYEHKVDESLNEDVNKINSTEDMLIQIVGDEYESGHILYDNVEQLKDDLINSFDYDFSKVDFNSLWTLYIELHDMGPEGFYAEYNDKYDFSDDFKNEYGLDDFDESLKRDPETWRD